MMLRRPVLSSLNRRYVMMIEEAPTIDSVEDARDRYVGFGPRNSVDSVDALHGTSM